MAYRNPALATPDAMRVGRLHTHLPGWADANVAFMRSGGYSISARIADVTQPTLVLWGRQDEILEPSYAAKFEAALPNGTLQWVEESGHCPHLEQPAETAAAILRFVGAAQAPSAGGGGAASGSSGARGSSGSSAAAEAGAAAPVAAGFELQ
jgi:pimeloyl-ACP methyl ester carboxylesterase